MRRWVPTAALPGGRADPLRVDARCMASGDRRGPVVWRTAALRDAGWTRDGIRRAVVAGSIIPIRRGLYASPECDARMIAAARHGGVPACVTAGAILGLWVLDDGRVHVGLGRGGHRLPHAECRCIEHWDGEAPEPGSIPSVTTVLTQIAGCRGAEAFFVALESALAAGRMTLAHVRAVRSRLPQDAAALLEVARLDAGSGTESLFRLRLLPFGIPIRSQVRLGPRHRADFLIGDRLLIEIDSRAHHDGPSARRRDLDRDADAAIWDYETLRFDYAQILHDWTTVEAAVLAKVAAGAHLRR